MRDATLAAFRDRRIPVLLIIDVAAWFAAMYAAAALHLGTLSPSGEDFHGQEMGVPITGVLVVAGVAAFVHVLAGLVVRLHQGRTAVSSFEESFLLVSVLAFAGLAATVVNSYVGEPQLPRATPVIATFIACFFCSWPRGLWRVLTLSPRSRVGTAAPTPVLVVGAGEGGRQLVQSMQRDPQQLWNPVGFIDDDRRKKHFRHRGLSVLGTVESLGRIAAQRNVSTVVVAIPSADSQLMSRVNDIALDAHLDVKVLPNVRELLSGVTHYRVRDLEPEDLLGRKPISTDLDSITAYLTGKRVLVTGAGGSIGSELCRQIAQLNPATLIMLDRDESGLHSLLLSIYGRADLEAHDVVLANIREADRVRDVFDTYRPEVVFHAAALKHVNLLEGHAGEAFKTNVIGTLNVLRASEEFGVERFVNISTDKAADPVNVLGHTKRLAEGLTSACAHDGRATYMSVRFGNVLGTNGSVLKTFAAQIESGGPVTVTHPDVTRFFMTVNEAVQLVIQAGVIGQDGDALVLDMGDAVPIADVARQLIAQSHRDIEVVFTGLKPGEKLHEVLFGDGEPDVRPVHPMVSHVPVAPVDPSSLARIDLSWSNDRIIRELTAMTSAMTSRQLTSARS
ncbi:MAG: polysaccharide biosynthesis protein [Aeromicrobium sp.]|nr:polysaccharide biosynthesis protein [Aeromicrobium sp.]